MLLFITALILYHSIHSLRMAAPDWRAAQIERLGDKGWRGAYSVAALGALVLLVIGYGMAYPDAPVLWIAPGWMNHVTVLLMLPAFVLMTFSMRSSRLGRNPIIIAMIIWAFAHLLANGNLTSVLLFGSFLIWAHANMIIAKKQGRGTAPLPPLSHDLAAGAAGVVLWAVFVFWAHEWIFGVSPLGG